MLGDEPSNGVFCIGGALMGLDWPSLWTHSPWWDSIFICLWIDNGSKCATCISYWTKHCCFWRIKGIVIIHECPPCWKAKVDSMEK